LYLSYVLKLAHSINPTLRKADMLDNLSSLEKRDPKVLKEVAGRMLAADSVIMAQLRDGLERAKTCIRTTEYPVDKDVMLEWLPEAISGIAITLFLSPEKLMSLQEAIQYGEYTDGNKTAERAAFAEALFMCLDIRPKRTAAFAAFTSLPSDEKAGGTYFKAMLFNRELTVLYKSAYKWGASNYPQCVDMPYFYANNYNAYGSKWWNRKNQDGSTRPVDVLNAMGSVAFKVRSPLTSDGLPVYNRELSEKELQMTGLELLRAQQSVELRRERFTQNVMQYHKWGKVYFAWYNDYRSRSYTHGSMCNPQGDEWSKSMFEFYETCKPTAYGLRELKMAVANTMGLDKETYGVRLQKVDELLQSGEVPALLNQIIDGTKAMPSEDKVEEPYLFVAMMEALLRAQEGQSVGAICHVDATASCLQIISASLGCVTGMVGSNVIENPALPEQRFDPYQNIYDSVKEYLPASMEVSRRDMKYDATMPFIYGGGAGVRKLFGEYENAFYFGTAKCFPAAYSFLSVLKDKWAKRRVYGSFTLPDGVVVHVNRTRNRDTLLRSRVGTMVLSDREIGSDNGQFVAHLSAMIHALDGWIVREVARHMHKLGKPFVTIHDSFGALPNDVGQLRYAYKKAMCRLVQEPILQGMIRELFSTDFGLTNPLSQEQKDEVCDLIMRSRYILC
jgi:hypothetical protein